MMSSWIFVSFCCICVGLVAGESVFNTEHRLLEKLFNSSTYDIDVFPLKNITGKLMVHVGIAVIKLGELDVANDAITMNTWLRFTWKDDRLVWKTSDYDDVKVIRVNNQRVWKPDVALFNSPKGDISLWRDTTETNALIYNDGTVLWIPPSRLAVWCDIDLRNFPFDTQHCTFKLGSWTYDGNRLDLDFYEGRKNIDLSDYIAHREWYVMATNATYHTIYYPCCVEPYPYIQFTIKFKRAPSYYSHVFIGPAVVMALLIPITFLMAPETGEKITLGVGIMICLILMALMLEVYLPTALSTASTLVLYYMCSFIMMGVSLAFTVCTTNMWWNRCRSQPPAVLKKVMVGCFGRLLCVNPSGYSAQDPADAGQGDDAKMVQPARPGNEWRVISIVVDRILFLVFLIVVIILTLSMLA